MKPAANMVECSTNKLEHTHLDYCWNCAPFWWIVPRCPTHNRKLSQHGFCKECRKYYDISEGRYGSTN